MEGSLFTASIARPLGWQGLGSFRKGRGPGTCQNRFLRASSFCLRADEVGLIMTNLEKANQVRRRLPFAGTHRPRVGGIPGWAERRELSSVSIH